MNYSLQHAFRRGAALALAFLLLGLVPALAQAPQGVSVTMSYTGPDNNVVTAEAAPIPYPGFENAFWLYVPPEAQQAPDAALTVTDLLSQYPGGFTLPQGTPIAEFFMQDSGQTPGELFIPVTGLGQKGEPLAEYRVYLSLSAPEPLPPETPAEPAAVTVRYLDQNGQELYSEQRTLQPGANTVTPDPAAVPADYQLTGPGEYLVNVTAAGAEPAEVSFTYQQQIAAAMLVIRYLDQNSQEFYSEQRTLQPGSNTVTPDPAAVPADYQLTGPGEYLVNVTAAGAEPAEVSFTYQQQIQAAAVTVRYLDQNGQELYSEQRTLQPGANTVTPDPAAVPADYQLTGPGEYLVNVTAAGAEPAEVSFTYQQQIAAATLVIRYLDQNGQAFYSEQRTLQPGPNTVTPDPAFVPEGYQLTGPGDYAVNVTEFGAEPPEVTFTYQKQVQAAEVLVRYLDQYGAEFYSQRRALQPGQNTVTPDPAVVPEGYQLTGQGEFSVSVTEFGAEPAEVTFTYQQPVPPASVTVRYVDQDGLELAAEHRTLMAGAHEITPDLGLLPPGYEPDGPQLETVSVSPDGASPDEITFRFRLVPVVSQPVRVPVSYVDLDGNTLRPDSVFEAVEGKNPVSPETAGIPEGYALADDPVKYVTVANNVAEPASLTFRYQPVTAATATPFVPKAALVDVLYKTEAGVTLHSERVPAREGEETVIQVNLGLLNPAEYQLVSPERAVITLDASGNPSQREVVFLFKDVTVKDAAVTVRYRNEAGMEIAPAQSVVITPGTHPIAAAPEKLPAGLELVSQSPVEVTLSQTGLLSQTEVVFVYRTPATQPPPATPSPEPTVIPFDVAGMDRWGYPTGDSINFRSSPDTASSQNVISVISRQDLAHILGSVKNRQGEEWYLAEVGGREGFLKASVVRLLSFNEAAALFNWTPTPAPTQPPASEVMRDGEVIDRWAEVTDRNGVNFRARATASSTKIGQLDLGERFWVYSQQTVGSDVWYSIMANGKTGFVMAKYTRLYSLQESAQYQTTLATPMPYSVTSTPLPPKITPAPLTPTKPPAATPPPATEPPAAYHGYALTTRQAALRTGANRPDEPVLEMLDANALVYVWGQTYVGSEGWSNVQVMADKMYGYVPNASLRYIDEQEAAYYLSLLKPQATPTPAPTAPPAQRTGYAITLGENVPMRSFADTNAQIMSLLPDGAVAGVLGQEYSAGASWHLVQYGSGFGYVRADQLRLFNDAEAAAYLQSLRTPLPEPAASLPPVTLDSPSSYGYVNSDRVNLRSGPSQQSQGLKLMSKNAFALVYGSSQQPDGLWYHISQDGTTGYVSSQYFTVLPMGELPNYLQSAEYLNANAAAQPQAGGYQQPQQITPVEDYNAVVWQNPNLANPSYEPFNPLGTATPSVEAILTPTPEPSASPSPTPPVIEGFEEPPEKADSSFPTGLLAAGLIALLGGGGYYAYRLYNQNQKRAAQRAAQRRAQQAQQSGRPQARPAQQQPVSPYAPPRPGMQGTPYRPGTPPQPGQAPQGTATYRPGTPPQPGQPGQAPQGTVPYRPSSFPPQGQPPTQGTATYRPSAFPPQGQSPQPSGQARVPYRPEDPGQARGGAEPGASNPPQGTDSRNRRSGRHGGA